MRTDYLSSTHGRWLEIVIGSVSAVVGLALLAGCFFFAYRIFGSPSDPAVIVLLVCAVSFALVLSVAGVRLLFNLRRRDGGLLPPLLLRVGGLIFFSAPILMIIQRDWAIIEAGFAIAAGVACFVLANRRNDIVIKPSQRDT